MKVQRQFTPLTIYIETEEELKLLNRFLDYTAHHLLCESKKVPLFSISNAEIDLEKLVAFRKDIKC